jgi:hypothetical protein
LQRLEPSNNPNLSGKRLSEGQRSADLASGAIMAYVPRDRRMVAETTKEPGVLAALAIYIAH